MFKKLCWLMLVVMTVMPLMGFVVASTVPFTEGVYLINQNFEGTGYDNGESWSTLAGSVNPDYTTTVLRGTQSFYAGSGNNSAVTTIALYDELWGHFRFRVPTGGTISNVIAMFELNEAADVKDCCLVRYDSGIQIYQTGGYAYPKTKYISRDTTYHVWVHAKKGTGANAIVELWWGTGTTRPTDTNYYATSTTGTWTSQMSKVHIGQRWSTSGVNIIIDQVIVDDEEFTTVAE